MTRRYLTLADVRKIHSRMIVDFGGSDGLRSLSGLESALARPQSGYYEDLIAEAAALWESLSQNHPFVDGNKRTAFAVADVFLRANGMRLSCPVQEAIAFVTDLYDTGQFRFERLEPWLREQARPV